MLSVAGTMDENNGTLDATMDVAVDAAIAGTLLRWFIAWSSQRKHDVLCTFAPSLR